MSALIIWSSDGEEHTIIALSETHVRDALSRLHQEFREAGRPTHVELVASSGDSLGVGLGRHFSNLNFVNSQNRPPYYISSGAFEAEVTGPFYFYFAGQYSEFPAWSAISYADAIEAVCFFYRTENLSTDIIWTQ